MWKFFKILFYDQIQNIIDDRPICYAYCQLLLLPTLKPHKHSQVQRHFFTFFCFQRATRIMQKNIEELETRSLAQRKTRVTQGQHKARPREHLRAKDRSVGLISGQKSGLRVSGKRPPASSRRGRLGPGAEECGPSWKRGNNVSGHTQDTR